MLKYCALIAILGQEAMEHQGNHRLHSVRKQRQKPWRTQVTSVNATAQEAAINMTQENEL